MKPPDFVVAAAIAEARRSPCVKSKRGVALYRASGNRMEIVGAGFNGPPLGLVCRENDACRSVCGRYCVHAEMRALTAAHPFGRGLRIAAVHAKVVDGALVAGGGPSCLPCATAVLDAGLESFWLYEARVEGACWVQYSATDFYNATVANVELWK